MADSCSSSQEPCGNTGRFKVELSSNDIWVNTDPTSGAVQATQFTIKVTALTADVKAQVSANYSGGSDLYLDDVTAFPATGSAKSTVGIQGSQFAWTGVDAVNSKLTGVSGLPSVAKGTTGKVLPGTDTTYAGEATISAKLLNDLSIDLGVSKITSVQWINGVASVVATIKTVPPNDNTRLDIAVQEIKDGSCGRTGSAKGNLRLKPSQGFFLVSVTPVNVLSSSSPAYKFNMTITAYDKDSKIVPGYGETISIDADTGSFGTPSSSTWTTGVCQINGQVYQPGSTTGIIKITVSATDGKTGYAYIILNSATHINLVGYDPPGGGSSDNTEAVQTGHVDDTTSNTEADWYGALASAMIPENRSLSFAQNAGHEFDQVYHSKSTVTKTRTFVHFNVGTVKGSAHSGIIYFPSIFALERSVVDGTIQTIKPFDSVYEIYAVEGGTSDHEQMPAWDAWQFGKFIGSFLRSMVIPDSDLSTHCDLEVQFDGDVINSLSGTYLGIIIVNSDEKLNAALPYLGAPPVSGTNTQVRRLNISGLSLYVY